jgi:O-succinylbenzoic acid--CoA ligase
VPKLLAVCLPAPLLAGMIEVAWHHGDAVLPIDPRLPAPARERLVRSLRPAELVDEEGVHDVDGALPVKEGDALVVATSGTTGEPKGAILTHRAIRASALATSEALGVDPSTDRWLACLPLSHIGGLSVVTRAILTATPYEVHDGFDAAKVEASVDEGVTLVSLVATALARIDASRFRRILLGGAAPPSALPPNVVTTYGMTETGSGIVYDGKPIADAEVRIEDGEIFVRGPMLFRAYRDDHDPRGFNPKDIDGWFATRDAGEIDADGRLVVHGRRGDLIITGGENVWPVAVEAVLAEHPGVGEVLVRGEPDPEWGQRVVAVVVPTDADTPPTLDELRAWAKERLAAYAAPRHLEVVTALPRTASGKPRRT